MYIDICIIPIYIYIYMYTHILARKQCVVGPRTKPYPSRYLAHVGPGSGPGPGPGPQSVYQIVSTSAWTRHLFKLLTQF